MTWFDQLRADLQLRQSRYRGALLALPAGLQAAWEREAPREFPGIPTDAFFFVRAAEGLMGFFDAVTRSDRDCALPSLAADSVWHVWLRLDAPGLEAFCRRQFGAAVPHLDRARLERGALAQTLVACRRLDGISEDGPALPRLFTLDRRLRMPRGHGYWPHPSGVAHARLDLAGRQSGRPRVQPELSVGTLLAAGLISAEVYAHAMRRQRDGADGGAATVDNGSEPGTADCADGGGGDGGGGGGGGGCGGGGD